jgi:hypothetical protein
MLEWQRLLFRQEGDSEGTVLTYRIVEPDTQQCVGIARESSPTGAGFFRKLFALIFPPTRIEFRETEDESLVFTVTNSFGLYGRKIRIADADENLVGQVTPDLRFQGADLWIYDWNHSWFARLPGDWRSRKISMTGADGSQLGILANDDARMPTLRGMRSFTVSFEEQLAEEPFAKMLLLGALVGLNHLYAIR